MRMGIGITEHDRPEVFQKCLKMVKKYAPDGAVIVVVDDASKIPVKEATYRFEKNVGIAMAKNRCLELLVEAGCDQLFLLDSDCWPIKEGWELPYIWSKEPHLCYIFRDLVGQELNDSVELYRDSTIKAYTHPRGCMLYFDRSVLDVVGGMDTRYKRWGYEHVDLSNRIFNNGLTSFRFADVVNSEELIHSGDEYQEVDGTVSIAERQPYLQEMKPLYEASFTSTEYCEFRMPKHNGNDIVLTTYLTSQPDPQRNTTWPVNYNDLKMLKESVERHGQRLVILNDCFEEPDTKAVQHVRVEATFNPYFQRWLACYQYLRAHTEIDRVFCVDATDVEMLRNPFPEMEDRIYVGDEPTTVADPWMIRNHPPTFMAFFRAHQRDTLLNSGILGGSRKDVMAFCHEIVRMYFDNGGNVGKFEMGAFNKVGYDKFGDRITHGRPWSTRFKSYDITNTECYFRHK